MHDLAQQTNKAQTSPNRNLSNAHYVPQSPTRPIPTPTQLPDYSCHTGRARPDPARARSGPARLARITNRAGPGRPTCPALCTSTARGPVWRAGPARYARRASWAVPARARLGICTRLPLSTQNDFKISNLRFKFTNRSQNRSTFHDNKFIKLSCFGCWLVKNLCR